jgi:hypothetical protein
VREQDVIARRHEIVAGGKDAIPAFAIKEASMRKMPRILLLVLSALLLAGCVSQPKNAPSPTPAATPTPTPSVEPTPIPTATPAPTTDPEVVALDQSVLELRKKCVNYGLNDRYKDDYAKAEEGYQAALALKDGDPAQAKESYAVAKNLYLKILSDGLSTLSNEAAESAKRLREAAVAEDAETTCPDDLQAGDDADAQAEALAAKEAQTLDDQEAAYAARKAAVNLYEYTYNRAKAISVKAKIDDKQFAAADQGNYDLATKKLDDAAAVKATDPRAALDAAQESLLRFNLVWKQAWELALGQVKSDVQAKKQDADALKAAKSAKEDYDAATAKYDEALSLEAAENYDQAQASYAEAGALFDQALATANEKKTKADDAFAKLKAKREQSKAAVEKGDAALSTSTQGEASK